MISHCGAQRKLQAASVNSTCSISFDGFPANHISIPGCFTSGTGTNTVTCNGIDGVTNPDSLDVLVFWDQEIDPMTGELDNSTCGNAANIQLVADCVDNGAEPSIPLFDNIANNYHSGEAMQEYNVQIFGAVGSSSYTLSMKDMAGNDANIFNATCGFCTDITYSGNMVSMDVNSDASKSLLINLQIKSDSQLSPHTSTIVQG